MGMIRESVDTLSLDTALIQAVQGGLPLVERPYAAIAAAAGTDESTVLGRLEALIDCGAIKRFGVIVRHQELGYRANAMVVWDLADERVDEAGARLGALPFVTLCYRRPRRLPDWPYNLFTMIHGRDRDCVLAQVALTEDVLGLGKVPHAVLFSGRRFKQRGARYRDAACLAQVPAGTRPPAQAEAGRPASVPDANKETQERPQQLPGSSRRSVA